MVVHVEKGNGEREATHDSSIHLASLEGISDDDRDEQDLNEGHLGHNKSFLDSLNFIKGFGGIFFHLSAVTWHFYYLLRK